MNKSQNILILNVGVEEELQMSTELGHQFPVTDIYTETGTHESVQGKV